MNTLNHFLNIDKKTAADPSTPYVVLPVPYERTVSYGQGTADGPAAILQASREVEDFDEELKTPLGLAVQTLRPLAFKRCSDRKAMDVIRSAAAKELKRRRFLLTLGGEHSITPPLVDAAIRCRGVRSVLQLDAHADLRDEFRGTRLSHACALRRCRELGVRTVHVGVRSCSTTEQTYIRQGQIPVFWAAEILESQDDAWMNAVCRQLVDPVYVTVDIDAFDPGLVPGTGTPEPGGLSWRHVTGLLRKVFSTRTVLAADIVEVAPMPHTQVSEYVAARLGAKMLLYHRCRK